MLVCSGNQKQQEARKHAEEIYFVSLPLCSLFYIHIYIYISWWTFRIFFIFFCSGEGKGESEAPGGRGGRAIFIENPRGGVSRAGGGGGGGPGVGRVFAGNLGRRAKYFFFGAEIPTKIWL